MQDIREIELEIVDKTQTPRYVSRFESLLYVPAFTQKDFHYVHTGPPTKETSTEEFIITKLGVHNSSLQHNNLYKRGKAQSQNNNHLYTRGMGTKPNNNHNHLYTRGIATNPKHNHFYTRGIGTKSKQRKDCNLVITIDHKQLLVITIDHK